MKSNKQQMKPNKKLLVFISLFLLFQLCFGSNSLYSDDSDSSKDAWTLEFCIRTALEKNPNYLSYKERVLEYESNQAKAFSSLLPSVSLYFESSEKVKSPSDVYTASTVVSQPIFRGGALYYGWKLAGMETTSVKLDVIRQSQYVTVEVKKAWYNLLERIELLQETRAALQRMKQHAENAKNFFKEGKIWRTDVLESEVRLARGEQDLIIAENDVHRCIARLNKFLHRDVSAIINPMGKLEWAKCDWTFDSAKDYAFLNRTDLKQAEIDMEKNQLSVKIANSGFLPSITADAKWLKSDKNADLHNGTENRLIEMNLGYNVWEWGKTKYQVESAKSSLRRSQLAIDSIKDQITLEIQEAWLSVREADKKIEVLKKALEQGEENFRVNIIRYQERLGTSKDVLDAEDLLTRTKKDSISALNAYLVAYANLEYSIGSIK